MHVTPSSIPSLSDIVAIAAGAWHSLALKADGTVWAWGANYFGQVGDGTTDSVHAEPYHVPGLTDVVAIAAGNDHSVALKADGTVWGWGQNDANQLGDGSMDYQPSPVQASGLPSPIIAIAAAGDHTVVTDAFGSVWSFGMNGGRAGNGDTSETWSPMQASPLAAPIALVGASESSSFGVTLDGTLWGWGVNDRSQLGDGGTVVRLQPEPLTAIAPVVHITGGTSHTVALRSDGTVWAWGGDDAGQLGIGTAPCPSDTDFACPERQFTSTPVAWSDLSMLSRFRRTARRAWP